MNYRDLQDCAAVLLELLEAQPQEKSFGTAAAAAMSDGFGRHRGAVPLPGLAGRSGTEDAVFGAYNTPHRDFYRDVSAAAENSAEVRSVPAEENPVGRGATVQFRLDAGETMRNSFVGDSAESGMDMETIDRFFRRDSRRYDKGFWENG